MRSIVLHPTFLALFLQLSGSFKDSSCGVFFTEVSPFRVTGVITFRSSSFFPPKHREHSADVNILATWRGKLKLESMPCCVGLQWMNDQPRNLESFYCFIVLFNEILSNSVIAYPYFYWVTGEQFIGDMKKRYFRLENFSFDFCLV